jgi:hypothetical protein
MSERFIKIYEPILHDKFLCTNRDLFALFVTLIIKAQYKDYKTDKGVIPRGSCILTKKWLGTVFDVDRRTITRWLEKLEKTDYITTKTIKGQNAATVVTIRNYSRYQDINGTSSGTSSGTPSGTTYKKDIERNIRLHNSEVNQVDYFGVDGADLRSSESDTNSAILWTELNTLWSTPEYEATLNKLYKTYWVKIAQADQESLLKFLRTCSDPNLSKVWKKPTFESGPVTTELLTKELAKYRKPEKPNDVYRNKDASPIEITYIKPKNI